MTPERWQQIESVFDTVIELPPTERARGLAEACGGDESLRVEVERLLAAHAREDGPLAVTGERPAVAFAATLLEQPGAFITPFGGLPAAPPPRIGPWRVLREAGAGGMGTVYLAERDDGAFRMRVALKLLRPGLHHDAAFVRRFRAERQVLARLDHPNIARLLDGGITDDGRPYYVMEFVDGAPIDAWCRARALPVDARLALFAKVCDAVAEAHAARIIHRDLKPSNILVTAEGEPKLLDFGIAKVLETGDGSLSGTGTWRAPDASGSAHALTRTGQRLLTPEYASPEQVFGEAVTAASDVYALGVVLHELLTGKRPFVRAGRTTYEIERAVIEERPARPSSLVPRGEQRALRGDIDAIILTSLRKEPERRYASARHLADDVRRHLAGAAVEARGDGAPYRLRTWLRRHRTSVMAAAVGVLVGGSALTFALERRHAEDDRPGFSEPVGTRSVLAARYYHDGLQAYARGNWGEAAQRLRAALAEDPGFAMAALYAADASSREESYVQAESLWTTAERLAGGASERDRLLVRSHVTERARTPVFFAYVDSLRARFPDDPHALLRMGRAAFWRGDYEEATRTFRRVLHMDSSAIEEQRVPCHACEAHHQLVTMYEWSDSLDAAEREARALARRQSESTNAWRNVARVTMYRGTPDEEAFRRALALDPGAADYAAEWSAVRRIREADYGRADAILRARLETAPVERRGGALWNLITSLRHQERWEEALTVARAFRIQEVGTVLADAAPASAIHEAQILLERGHGAAAAALYDSIARYRGPNAGLPTSNSLHIWHLVHRADALALAGDTLELGTIADSVRALSATSVWVRDQRLEHHVRGLLFAARGDHAAAVDAYRRAMTSPNLGYTRTNLMLAQSLLALGRAREAVAVLQPALRGSLEVNNFYVTHTALHAALAEAWRMAGEPDSAAMHAAWVALARGGTGAPIEPAAFAAVSEDETRGTRFVPGTTRRVAFDAALELDPAVSPDGTRLAYASDESGRMQIQVRPLDGGPAVVLAPDVNGQQRAPRWSPDGRTILFQSDGRIMRIASDGGAAGVLVTPARGTGWVGSPAWSPDGQRIAYVQEWQIHVRDATGGTPRRVAERAVEPHSLAWSPDGRWLAYVDGNVPFVFGEDPRGSTLNLGNQAPSSIWVVSVSDGTTVRITDVSGVHASPVWTSDSRTLLFVSARDGDRDVYAQGIDGAGRSAGGAQRLTAGLGAHGISLASDDSRLAYAVFRNAANIWRLPIGTTSPSGDDDAHPVTRGSQSIEGLDVSRDGRWLAFDSDRGGRQDLYRLPLDDVSAEPSALTNDPADEFMPHWSPDGALIVYYRFGADGQREMRVVPAGGGASLPVLAAPRNQRSPRWSPDGRSLVFSSNATGRDEVYLTTRTARGTWSAARRMSPSGGYAARFSPDGRTVSFLNADGVWTIPVSGGAVRHVHRIPRTQESALGFAEWSADGRSLYYKWIDDRGQASWYSVPVSCAAPATGTRVSAACTPRLVARLAHERRLSPRPEFSSDGRHFYFTIAERSSDVWVMALRRDAP